MPYDYIAELRTKVWKNITLPTGEFTHLLKLDISGIQEFIFHVQSEKATRTLKGRSLFVQVLGWLLEEVIRDKVGGSNQCYTLYNGGGNLYMLLRSAIDRDALQLEIDEQLRIYQLYACVSQVTYDATMFGDSRRRLEVQSVKDKQRKYKDCYAGFNTFSFTDKKAVPNPMKFDWSLLTGNLADEKITGYQISDKTDDFAKVLNHGKGIVAFGKQFLLNKTEHQFKGGVVDFLPLWTEELIEKHSKVIREVNADAAVRNEEENPTTEVQAGNVIEFSALALMAGERNGTPRLGILKMDVDNLGTTFNRSLDLVSAKRLSASFSWFFEHRFRELLAQDFQYETYHEKGNSTVNAVRYADNLYVVFAGGDDCFVIGGWDVVFGFAELVQAEFTDFISALAASSETKEIDKNNGSAPTLSAGLVVVNRKFPAIRFARSVETAEGEAKTYIPGEKNRITLFDEAITWSEFKQVKTNAEMLAEILREGHYQRSLLYRIKNTSDGFERLRERVSRSEYTSPRPWQLDYFLGRNSKDSESKMSKPEKEALDKIKPFLQSFAKDLMSAFVKQDGTSHMVYPLAARWAEFLTSKTSK